MKEAMKYRKGLWAALLTLTVSTAVADTPGPSARTGASSADQHVPMIVHQRHGKNVTSTNWSGYAVTGTNGSVTDVKGSWVVPAIQGSCPSTNQYSSSWLGIDGYSSSTVEQIGTDSDCQNGAPSYYAWFEFYPHPAFIINSLAVHPGDVMSAEVNYAGGRFTATLTNATTGQQFSTSAKVGNAKRSSAEWIVEAPWSGGVLPLADFGTDYFGQNYTFVPSTNTATVGNVTAQIGAFGNSVSQITMVTSSGVVKALPSALSADGTSFSDSWLSSGP